MSNAFVDCLAGYGLTLNNSKAYGKVKGYETNLVLNFADRTAPVKVHISFYATQAQKETIKLAIESLGLKYFTMKLTPYGLQFGVGGSTVANATKNLPTAMEQVYAVLTTHGAQGSAVCPMCGLPLDATASVKEIDGIKIKLDAACVDRVNASIQAENEAFKNAPNNYLRGFLGACIGGLAGAAIAVVLYMVGFISALSALVSVVLGTYLYQKVRGKPNKMMVVIVTLTTLVFMVASVLGVYLWAAGEGAREAGVAMSAWEAFTFCMGDAEFARLFYTDLGMVLLFSVIGIAYEIVTVSRSLKRRQSL